jgi:hypothetical protein
VVGVLKTDLHESMVRGIDFDVELGALDGKMASRWTLCNGAVEVAVVGEEESQYLTLREWTPGDYFTEEVAGPVRKVSLQMRDGEADPVTGKRPALLEGGELTLGSTVLTMARQEVSVGGEKLDDNAPPLLATAQVAGVAISVGLEILEKPPFCSLELSSEFERTQEDLIALLWVGKPHAELDPAEAREVKAVQERHFSEVE